jgi:hypothetical protein
VKYSGQQYLRAEHLLHGGKYISASVTISAVIDDCPIKKGDKEAQTIGLAFEKSDKVLGLNRTNFSNCCWELGEGKPESWVGKKITLVVRLVRNKSLVEPAIRVWPTKPHPNARVREQMGQEITAEWYAAK